MILVLNIFTGAHHVIHRLMYRSSTLDSPHSVPVRATSFTALVTGARHVVCGIVYRSSPHHSHNCVLVLAKSCNICVPVHNTFASRVRATYHQVEPRNLVVDVDPRSGRYLAASAMFRGEDISMFDVEVRQRNLPGCCMVNSTLVC